MGCFSSKPVANTSQPSPRQPPPPTGVPQQTQSRGENVEHRQGYGASPPPVSPPRGSDATAVPAKSVPTDESIPALNPPQSDRQQSQKPPPRSSRPDLPPKLPPASQTITRTTSVLHFDSARRVDWAISEGETSRKPLHESGGSNPSPSLRPISRTASVDTHHNARHRAPRAPPTSFGRGGHVGMDLNSQAGPRAGPTRAATTGNNTRPSLLPTVQEVLPEGFRYAHRP